MSRFEREWVPAGEASLSRGELSDLLGASGFGDRRAAIACYLSASEGWDEARTALRGRFAGTAAAAGSNQDKRQINHRASEYLQRPPIKHARTDND